MAAGIFCVRHAREVTLNRISAGPSRGQFHQISDCDPLGKENDSDSVKGKRDLSAISGFNKSSCILVRHFFMR